MPRRSSRPAFVAQRLHRADVMNNPSEPRNEPVWWDGVEPPKLPALRYERPRRRVRRRRRDRRSDDRVSARRRRPVRRRRRRRSAGRRDDGCDDRAPRDGARSPVYGDRARPGRGGGEARGRESRRGDRSDRRDRPAREDRLRLRARRRLPVRRPRRPLRRAREGARSRRASRAPPLRWRRTPGFRSTPGPCIRFRRQAQFHPMRYVGRPRPRPPAPRRPPLSPEPTSIESRSGAPARVTDRRPQDHGEGRRRGHEHSDQRPGRDPHEAGALHDLRRRRAHPFGFGAESPLLGHRGPLSLRAAAEADRPARIASSSAGRITRVDRPTIPGSATAASRPGRGSGFR